MLLFFEILLISTFLIFCYMSIWFIISLIKNDTSVVDTAWGPGFLLLALYWLYKTNLFLTRQLVVTFLVALWAIRLAIKLGIRSFYKGEDSRYTKMKQHWQKNKLLKIFTYVFMLQGALIIFIASPVIAINVSTVNNLNFLDYFGITIWCIGFFFEVVSDWQLDKFLANPKNRGRIMQYGLWRYSRHPNYFDESLMWWAFFLIALNVPWGALTIISPFIITYLLLFVSGIPISEKMLENNPEFQEYKKNTSPFIPMPKNQ